MYSFSSLPILRFYSSKAVHNTNLFLPKFEKDASSKEAIPQNLEKETPSKKKEAEEISDDDEDAKNAKTQKESLKVRIHISNNAKIIVSLKRFENIYGHKIQKKETWMQYFLGLFGNTKYFVS